MAELETAYQRDKDGGHGGTLSTFLTAISGVSDELDRARLIATGVPSLLSCSLSGVALLDEAEERWRLVVQEGGQLLSFSETEEVLSQCRSLFDQVFRESNLMRATFRARANGVEMPRCLAQRGLRSLALAKLRTLRSRIGVLFAGRDDPGSFSPAEEWILLALSEHSAIGVENLRLYRAQQRHSESLQELVDERTAKLRESERRQRAVLEINNAIISNLDRESLFQAVAQAFGEVLAFDRATLILRDATRDVLQVYARAGVPPKGGSLPVGLEFPLQGSHLMAVFTDRRPVICRDLEQERCTDVEGLLLEEGIHSYIAVPLVAKEEVLGSLSLCSLQPDRYSEHDAPFLVQAGHQVALAINNTLAYEEIAALKARLEQENIYLQDEITTGHNFEEIIGDSAAIRAVLDAIATVADTEASLLITGETGTGKELVARAVHRLSRRRERPLMKVNCASVPRELFESEFFGHVKGSFTGAFKNRVGRFQLADGGTLFLDEVGEIPLDMQAKLLRVLQDGEFERVGDDRTRRVNVRVIAATNRDLRQEAAAGRFRQDLYYRLNVFPIEVAPLRRRKEDIPLLAAHLLPLAARELNRPLPRLTEANIRELRNYDWPGNIRELRNVLERAVITSKSGHLQLDLATQEGATGLLSDERIAETEEHEFAVVPEAEMRRRERDNILAALRKTRWKIYGPGGAAELLDINAATLASRVRKLGLKQPDSATFSDAS